MLSFNKLINNIIQHGIYADELDEYTQHNLGMYSLKKSKNYCTTIININDGVARETLFFSVHDDG
jgi:hypothetical protein